MDANGVPGFEALRVEFGVYSDSERSCNWSVWVRDRHDVEVDEHRWRAAVARGETGVTVDLNGSRFLRRGLDGPYQVTIAGGCDGSPSSPTTHSVLSRTTVRYSRRRKYSRAASRTLPPVHALDEGTGGSSPRSNVAIQVTPTGGFRGKVAFVSAGLPADANVEFKWPQVFDEVLRSRYRSRSRNAGRVIPVHSHRHQRRSGPEDVTYLGFFEVDRRGKAHPMQRDGSAYAPVQSVISPYDHGNPPFASFSWFYSHALTILVIARVRVCALPRSRHIYA